MGASDSKQKLGERVIAARMKMERDRELQDERIEFLKSNSPKTLNVLVKSISDSFDKCAPFLEHSLLLAWQSDGKKCEEIILKSCKKVLSAPIRVDEYKWFEQYVLPSSIWFYKINSNSNKFMFEELLNIVKNMSTEIINTMNSIYSLFQSHPKWNDLMNIKNETIISRQDNKKVGLLADVGITDICDIKQDGAEDMQTFIDSNLAVNILTTKAKELNNEFQNHISSVMSHCGKVKSGPLKKVERCQSKLENDYPNETFPKAAKLLDLIRCSVTFNTLDQLIDGYKSLMNHINKNASMVELSRIKNGFLDANYSGGYRDIKINIVYHSQINRGDSMICEVQLLLLNYLHEKKRIHKLYSIARQELYFQMVVTGNEENNNIKKDITDVKLEPILKVGKGGCDMKTNAEGDSLYKCSVDTDLNLLAIESGEWFGAIHMNTKKVIFEQKRVLDGKGRHSHRWLNINHEKYLAAQTANNIIKMYNVGKNNIFKENEEYRITVGDKDVINFVEFDKNFENIFIVTNAIQFEQRSMKNVNKVLVKIKLEEEVHRSGLKQLTLSDDGKLCAIGAGMEKNYFYLIDIQKKKQYKLSSNFITHTYLPRFVNGETQFIAIADRMKNIEIWNIKTQKPIRTMNIGKNEYITAMTTANNILAVGSWDHKLLLYDVRNWKLFFSENYNVGPYSLHLTNDSKYLTIGGQGGAYRPKCVVLRIK